MLTKFLLFSGLMIAGAVGQFYEDKRCRCICPSIAEVLNLNDSLNTKRKLYIADVPPSKCNCDEVILPHIGDEIKGHEQEYCPRCECKYEMRNTAVIKVVVIMVIWVLTLLLVYSGFLICLNPLIRPRRYRPYKEHNTEEANEPLMNNFDMN